MKTLCPIHHLFYNGAECPLCKQERIDRYSQKFGKKTGEKKPVEKEDREITENDLQKLIDKFNTKKKNER